MTPRNVLVGTLGLAAVAGLLVGLRHGGEAGLAIAVVVAALGGGVLAVVRMVRQLLAPEPPRGRPGFARSYPRRSELDALLEAFEAGNFRQVRDGAKRLVEGSEDEEVRRAAQDLRRRIAPDPTAVYLLGIGVLLALVVAGYYLSHGPH